MNNTELDPTGREKVDIRALMANEEWDRSFVPYIERLITKLAMDNAQPNVPERESDFKRGEVKRLKRLLELKRAWPNE